MKTSVSSCAPARSYRAFGRALRRLAPTLMAMTGALHGTPFTAGNLAVLRADSNAANNTTVTIVELNTTAAAQSPTNAIAIDGATLPNALRFSGSATSTGYLSLSADGTLLTFMGHNSTTTGVNVNTLTTRGVGTLDASGVFALQTTYTGTSGNQTRSATSLNNTAWFIADQGGVYSNGTSTASPAANIRAIRSFGGTVYTVSTATTAVVSTVTAATGGAITGLPGLAADATAQDFYMISSGSNGAAFDVLYVLTTAGVKKYSLVTGAWTANGSYAAVTGFGLAAARSGGGADLYVSTGSGATAANNVVKLTDTTGFNAAISVTTANNVTLYTAPAGTTVKGVAFAPAALTPTPLVTIAATDSSAAELPVNAGTFRMTRTGDATNPLTVNYTVATGAGQAVAPADYTPALSGSATIPATQSFVDVTITPADDIVLEGDETVALTITDTVDYNLGATITASVIITDNETTIDLSRYVRVGRYDLPEPTRTTPPSNNLLAQEASGVAFNWDSNTLFIVGDGGTSVTEVAKTGTLISTMTLATGSSPQGTEFYDTEGITYIGGGQFVMTEERDRQAVKFTYVAGGTLARGAAQTMKLGTTIGNIGLEGLSYDPQTSGFLFAKEADPQGLFQTTIDFTAGTASNGSPTTVNSTHLFSPALASLADMSDVFAFSNLPAMTSQPQAGNMLILSQESGLIRNMDRSGNIVSTLTLVSDVGNPLSIQNQTHEGITMDRDGFIYVVSENGGGDIDHPQLWVYAPSNAANTAPTAIILATSSSTIPENTSTAAAVQMTNTTVTDADGIGVNALSVSGADAASFEIIGTALYLKAGTVLNGTTKPTYNVTVNVDDTSVGSTPDASANFTLNVTPVTSGASALRITEVAPWSSGNSAIAADWFELTNTGATALDITGWKMNDSAASFGSAGPLTGITSIGAGESVIFVDGSAKPPVFIAHWFGATAPAGFQIGYYGGPGLSTGGDSVTIYDAGGTLRCRVDFGTSTPAPGPYRTFDNTAGLNNATITVLSTLGANGAFTASATANEIGSPGSASLGSTPLVSIVATDATAAEAGTDPGTFRISRTGSTTSAMTVILSIATGSGQATSGDYTPALTSPATIPAGASFIDLTITPVDDTSVEGSETVTITLGDTGSYDVGSPATATVTINDNDVNLPPTAVVFSNTVPTLVENTSTAADVRAADISITDDGNGTNALSLSGADAASFVITGNSLYLKAGTTLSYATKPTYNVTVNVDDTTVGTNPDASANFVLNITQYVAPGTIVITEVNPNGSSSSYVADWIELTNTGVTDVNITGWQMDDNSNGTAKVAMRGMTVIPAGKTAVFFEGLADGSTDATILANLCTAWFGSPTPPSGVLIGAYGGAGVGLSSGGDAVNIFDAAGNRVTGVAFAAVATGTTLDNKTAAAGSTTLPLPIISTLSVIGTNGAFRSAANTETGSPGYTVGSTFSFASATYSVGDSAGSVTLTINRAGGTSPATVTVNTANATATAGTDYTAVTAQTVSFAANATTATVNISVSFRPGIQGSRTFTAALSGATTTAPATTTITITEADTFAASTGPSSSKTPYVLPLNGNWQTKALLTVGDGPGGYQMAGIPDGLGAYDNGDGTLTLLMNHELGKTVGVTRAHGAIGSFVSEWVINKSTLAVVSGSELMTAVYNWNNAAQVSDTTPSTIAFSRFCSADLPPVSAFYNAATGKGTQTRIFMNGEESTGGGSNGLGYVVGHVATGANKGKSYILGKFNSATDGNTNGVTGWGGWENVVASPYPQDKTVVIAPSDGGTAGTPHINSVVVYIGTKTNIGTEVDKAGLTNGVLKFINVTGNAAEIANTTTRATNITSGTAFTLSATAATTFSRPEDGSWDPTNPNVFYFVTTDQRDDVNDTIGAQVGRTRLWRLNFTSITTPELGGTIDLVLTGGTNVPAGNDANMWDNMTVTSDGKLMLQEDVGGAAHNGKVWFYDPTTGSLTKVLKHDVARFGDRTGGVTTPATAPYTNDEETSGVIDVTSLFGGNAVTGDRTYLMVDQAHYTSGISAANVEGGQLLLVHQTSSVTGPSTAVAPYVLPISSDFQVNSLLTVGEGPGGYQMAGIPDGLGAYDNGDGTLTLLMNHELGKTVGVTRAHGAIGSFVSEWVINKSTLAVVSGSDLMTTVYNWNSTTQVSDTTPSTIAFSRFCSADLPPVSSFYNAATGKGTQTRIFMNGEESTGGGSNGLGYAVGHIATGADKGKSYILGKFNSATDGNTNGVTGWGGWENVVASPYPQDKTVVVAPSDGGTAATPHNNSVVVYVGTKTNTGSEVDKAGLTNGVLRFVNVTGNPVEIVNSTTRATNITSGTAFTLSATAATTFSRPEDGSWDPTNPNHFYFVTTDQIDRVNDGIGPQIGRTRLWRLNFANITTPEVGGTIDLVLTGGVGNDANMWDNMTVTDDGKLMLQEDVGGAPHNGKVWFYDPVTGSLTKVLQHNPALFGDLTTPATLPYTNDEETSGVIDVSAIFGSNAAAGQRTYLMVDQAHYTTGISAANVEGGQLLLVRQTPKIAFSLAASTNSVNETAGSLSLTVNRYGDIQYAATVNVSTANGTAIAGTDFTALSSFAVNFAPGETTKNVSVSITNRSGLAADRTFTVTLAPGAGAAAGAPSSTTVTIVSTPTLLSWRQLHFGTTAGTGATADDADYDGDGIQNLMEYGLGINPTIGTGFDGLASLPAPVTNDANPLLNDRLSLSFDVDNPVPGDITYIVRVTDDVVNWTPVAMKTGTGPWTWVGGGASRIITTPAGARTNVRVGDIFPADATHPRRMMQLMVTTP